MGNLWLFDVEYAAAARRACYGLLHSEKGLRRVWAFRKVCSPVPRHGRFPGAKRQKGRPEWSGPLSENSDAPLTFRQLTYYTNFILSMCETQPLCLGFGISGIRPVKWPVGRIKPRRNLAHRVMIRPTHLRE